MARLVLVGLPGAGKTTLAGVLAQHWGCDVVDTDDVLATKVGEPAADYLRQHGEEEFRRRELDALRTALQTDAVIATGAGIVTTAPARALIAKETVVWLDCNDATLTVRVGPGERPLLGEDHAGALARLRSERESWYESVARVRIDASGTPDEVASRILHALGSVAP
ncbi:MAG TPA: shikimate kinase [Acidimicrobiales bacterium]